MAKRYLSILKYTVSLGLAVVLLWLAFRNVELEDFWAKAQQVDYFWVILSIILSLLAYAARAYRWNLLIAPQGFPGLTTYRTTLAVLVGYLANLAFPRLGEVTRCGMLRRSDEVPVSTSLGTVIVERLIDLISLIILLLIALWLEYDRLLQFLQENLAGLSDTDGLAFKGALILAGLGLLALAVAYVLYVKLPKVRQFVRELYQGVLSVKDVRKPWAFVLSTVVLWVTYYFMSWIVVFSIPETAGLGWAAGLMLLITGGIALAIPVQGGIGTYHTLISAMLALYAVDKTTGVFLATLLHTSQIVAIAIFGGIALILSFFVRRQVKNESNKA